MEHCGLDHIFQMAEDCNLALLSCGGIDTLTTSYRVGYVSEAERQSMIKAGVVGDILYNFVDRNGNIVDHPVNKRSISMPLDRLSRVQNRVLMSGGREKIDIIRAAMTSLKPHILITDEATVASLLALQNKTVS